MHRRAGLGVAALAAVVVSCSARQYAGPNDDATRTVRLHGSVSWSDSMPPKSAPSKSTPPESNGRTATTNTLIDRLPPPQPYESAAPLQICTTDLGYALIPSKTILARGSNGETIASAPIETDTLNVVHLAFRPVGLVNRGADFTCEVRWRMPPVPRQVAYFIDFNGHVFVVGGWMANRTIDIDI